MCGWADCVRLGMVNSKPWEKWLARTFLATCIPITIQGKKVIQVGMGKVNLLGLQQW